jgi:hypothetical protein
MTSPLSSRADQDAAEVSAWVTATAATISPLTAEQTDRIAVLLWPERRRKPAPAPVPARIAA